MMSRTTLVIENIRIKAINIFELLILNNLNQKSDTYLSILHILVLLGSLHVFSLLSQICRSVQGALQGLMGTQCLTRPAFRQNLFSMFNCAQSLFVPQLSSVSIWHLLVLSQNCSSLHSFLVGLDNSPYFVGFLRATVASLEAGQEEAGSQVFVPPFSSCLHTDFPFTPTQSKLEEQGTEN